MHEQADDAEPDQRRTGTGQHEEERASIHYGTNDSVVRMGAMVKSCYYKGKYGNKLYDMELMLRIHILQKLYNLADMAVMNEIMDSRAFSQFCGVDSGNQVPDGDTIGHFWRILEKNRMGERFLEQIVEKLRSCNLILQKGTIVDSTLISAPSSTKNKNEERDTEAHQVNRNGELVQHHINLRPSQMKKYTGIQYEVIRVVEHAKSSIRCKVEHVFCVIKRIFLFRRPDTEAEKNFISIAVPCLHLQICILFAIAWRLAEKIHFECRHCGSDGCSSLIIHRALNEC